MFNGAPVDPLVRIKKHNYSVFELSETLDIIISPNPVSDEIIIDGAKFDDRVLIYDILGKVHPYKIKSNTPLVLNVESLEQGIYFVNIKRKGINKTLKILKE